MYSKNLISVSIIIVCIYTWSAGAVGVLIPTAFKYVFNSTQKLENPIPIQHYLSTFYTYLPTPYTCFAQ